MRPRSVRLRARSGPETAISPTSRAFRPRITASMSSSLSVALGPTVFNERAVHTARQVAHLLYPVTKERGACRHFQVVDVAVQGLVHSKDELRHAAKSS